MPHILLPATRQRLHSHLYPQHVNVNDRHSRRVIFTAQRYASAVYAVVVCLSVRPSQTHWGVLTLVSPWARAYTLFVG